MTHNQPLPNSRSELPDGSAIRNDTSRTDVYRKVTNQIVKAIEEGAGDWRMPWHSRNAEALSWPVNAETKLPYRGVNVVALWAEAQDKGYASRVWATYKQWEALGANVRRGEHASWVVFWKFDQAQEEEQETGNEGQSRRRVIARGYPVFNADQVNGYASPTPPVSPKVERIAHAETFFAATGAKIVNGGKRAFYSPPADRIQIPPFEAFPDPLDYYSVLGHETTHWTGAKSRLDRDLSGRFGTHAYAAEELVAELGAAFLAADLELENEPRPDHAAYVANWLELLKNDPRAIFTAAAKAQKAVGYLHALHIQTLDSRRGVLGTILGLSP